MLPYYTLVLLPFFVYIIGFIKGKRLDKLCIGLFFLIFIILLSLRSVKVGIDLKNYSHFFEIISRLSLKNTLSFSEKGEKLFYIINKLVSSTSGNFQFFLFVVALLSVVPVCKLYYKNSNNALLTIALFLTIAPFTMFFSALRQCIAMGIVIFAFRFVEDKKPLKFFLVIFIAFLFHRSAVFCLPLYAIYYAKITRKWLYVLIPLMFLIFLFNKEIFSVLLSFTTLYDGKIESTGAYSILILLILFGIYCFLFSDENRATTDFIGLRNILLFSIIIQCFVPLNHIVMRINYYYLLFIPILIPKVQLMCKKSNVKLTSLISMLMIVFFISYFLYNSYHGSDVLEIFPYIPFWEV